MWPALLVAYLAVAAFTWWLRRLNLRHLASHGDRVPGELEGVVDEETLRRVSSYTRDKHRLGAVRSAVSSGLVLAFFFGGLLGAYDRWVAGVTDSFVSGGVVFFTGLAVAEILIGAPFSLYSNFVLEARHGFNTMTGRTWLADLAKSTVLSLGLLAGTAAAALWLVRASPVWWWLWVWAFFLGLGVVLMYVSPYLIEPLFFRFEPLRVEGLEERIRDLVRRAGIRVSRVYRVDASRRSRHSNAYFTGIGRVKRIVLFDTLLEGMGGDEVLAVVAHEAGHWTKRHVLKRFVATEIAALAGLWLAHHMIHWEGLPGLVGLERASFHARVLIVGLVGSVCLFPATPLLAFLSRRHEWQADAFAAEITGRPGALARALALLARENLSNLHPHPLYAWFHFSHPPVIERIRALVSRQ